MGIENKDIWQLRIDKSPKRGSNGYSGRNAHERINDMKKDRRRHNETQKKDFKFTTCNLPCSRDYAHSGFCGQ